MGRYPYEKAILLIIIIDVDNLWQFLTHILWLVKESFSSQLVRRFTQSIIQLTSQNSDLYVRRSGWHFWMKNRRRGGEAARFLSSHTCSARSVWGFGVGNCACAPVAREYFHLCLSLSFVRRGAASFFPLLLQSHWTWCRSLTRSRGLRYSCETLSAVHGSGGFCCLPHRR